MLAVSAILTLFDLTDHALVLVEFESGRVLRRLALPREQEILALWRAESGDIFLFTNNRTCGTLYMLSDDQSRLIERGSFLPLAHNVCLSPSNTSLYLAGLRHSYRFDLVGARLTALNALDAPTCIAADNDHWYTACPQKDGTRLSVYDKSGAICFQHLLSGSVTTLHRQDDFCYLPFVQSPLHGEGLYILRPATAEITTVPVTMQTVRALSAYPYSVLVQNDIIYLTCENAATITRIDAHTHRIIDCIPLGRSITHLYPLTDPRFAIATSNMFADLVLIDLVNRRLLTLSLCPHELFHQLAVLPQ